MYLLAGHNLPRRGALLVGHALAGDIVTAITAAVSGVTDNPTYGATAQTATQLTGVGSQAFDSQNWQLDTGSGFADIAGATALSYTPVIGVNGATDLARIRLRGVVDGVSIFSPSYRVRQAPPVVGTVSALTGTQGDGPFVVDLTAVISGDDVSFEETVAWASISGNTLTIADAVRTDALTITGANSGGSVAVDLSVIISGVALQPPVAAGALPDVSFVKDSAITAINVAADFTGSGITYALAPSSAALPVGLALSSAGMITGTPTTPAAQVNIIVRGTNSGGFDDTGFGIGVSEFVPPVMNGALPYVLSASAPTSFVANDLQWTPYESATGDMLELNVVSLPNAGSDLFPFIEYQIEIPGSGWSNWYALPWGWSTGTRLIKTFSGSGVATALRVRPASASGPGAAFNLPASTPLAKPALGVGVRPFGALDPVNFASVPTAAPDGTYAGGQISVSGGQATRLTSPLTPGTYAAGPDTFEVTADAFSVWASADFTTIHGMNATQLSERKVLVAPGVAIETPGTGLFNKLANLTAPLRIESMDHTNQGRITRFNTSVGTGNVIGPLHFANIEVTNVMDPNQYEAGNPTFGSAIMNMVGVHGLRVENCEIYSNVPASGEGGLAEDAIIGIDQTGTQFVQVVGCEFHHLFYNMKLGSNSAFEHNNIHHTYADGINLTGESENVVVRFNSCTNWTGDAAQIHPDQVQFHAVGYARNIHIEDNTYYPGDLTLMRPSNDPFLGIVGVLDSTGGVIDTGALLSGAGNLIDIADMNRAWRVADGGEITLPDATLCAGEHVTVEPFNGLASVTVRSTSGQTHATLVFPFTFIGNYNNQKKLTFRSNGTGWERQTPGLRTGTLLLIGNRTLGRQHWSRILYADNRTEAVTLTLNPAPSNGENFYLSPFQNANSVTVAASGAQTISGVDVASNQWSASQLRKSVKFTYASASDTWLVTEAPLVLQGFFSNNNPWEGVCRIKRTVFGCTAAWAFNVGDPQEQTPDSASVDVFQNYFGAFLLSDLDGSGSVGPSDGFIDNYSTGIARIFTPRLTYHGNITSGSIDNSQGVVGQNITLGVGPNDAELTTRWTSRLELPIAGLRSAQTAAAALAATQVKTTDPLAAYVGPLAGRTAALAEVAPAPFIIQSENTADLPADLPVKLTLSLPIRRGTAVLIHAATSAVVPATVTIEGYKLVLTPNAVLTPGDDYRVSAAVDDIVSRFDTGTDVVTNISFTAAAEQGDLTPLVTAADTGNGISYLQRSGALTGQGQTRRFVAILNYVMSDGLKDRRLIRLGNGSNNLGEINVLGDGKVRNAIGVLLDAATVPANGEEFTLVISADGRSAAQGGDSGDTGTAFYYLNGVNRLASFRLPSTFTLDLDQLNVVGLGTLPPENTQLAAGQFGRFCMITDFAPNLSAAGVLDQLTDPAQTAGFVAANGGTLLFDVRGTAAEWNAGTANKAGTGAFIKAGSDYTDDPGAIGPAQSSDANLSTLTLSEGALSPIFASGTTAYTASVANGVTSTTVGAAANDAGASIAGRGAVALAVGSNAIDVVVTAEDGTQRTYAVTVTRAAAQAGLTYADSLLPDLSDAVWGSQTLVGGWWINPASRAEADSNGALAAATGQFTICQDFRATSGGGNSSVRLGVRSLGGASAFTKQFTVDLRTTPRVSIDADGLDEPSQLIDLGGGVYRLRIVLTIPGDSTRQTFFVNDHNVARGHDHRRPAQFVGVKTVAEITALTP